MIPLFKLYRYGVSPALHLLLPGYGCRFTPTCSQYAQMVWRTFPFHRALFLIGRRLLRCHPLFPGGVDFPPDAASSKEATHP